MPFIPHTQQDIAEMLMAIGVDSIDDLFVEIPQSLRDADLSSLAPGLTEMELARLMQARAKQDAGMSCFIGAGAYEHHIPAAVWDIATRGEFLTSYTPYQAEASQGTLQLLYEYQTMMASLMALDVSNASLYDGASALAEAVLMAVRLSRKATGGSILVPKTIHPHYRAVLQTIVGQQGIQLVDIPYDSDTGCIAYQALQQYATDALALIIPQPNFFGLLEDVDNLTNWAHANQALAIAVVNPLSMALLKAPGQWGEKGADIACGEGQPLGVPLASGGPYYGFLCCKIAYVRQLPGRIAGRTIDRNGKEGFVLTLQAREQHIRRAKATSNICTNQGLLITASTIYLSLLGPKGLRQNALVCHHQTTLLRDALSQIEGVTIVFAGPYFHELVIKLPQPAKLVLEKLASFQILGGYDLSHYFPELTHCILICATETKTDEDIFTYRDKLQSVLHHLASGSGLSPQGVE